MTAVSRGFAMVFAVALAARLLVLFAGPWSDTARASYGDTPRYLTLAGNLDEYGSFGLVDEEPARAWHGLMELQQENGTLPSRDRHGLLPEVLRTPGYPLSVAAVSRVGGGDPRAVLLFQCILGALAAGCVRQLGRAIGLATGAATAAGILWALHPGLVLRDSMLLTESLFNSLGVFGLTAAACGPRGWKGWVLAGSCLGFAGLVRPLGMLFVPIAAIYAARRADRRWLAVTVLASIAALPSAGWAVRNAAVGNGLRVSTVGNVTLFYYFAGYSISEEQGADWQAAWPARSEELLAKLRGRVGPGDDVYRVMGVLSIEELKARPGPVAKVQVKSWAKLYIAHTLGEAYPLFGLEYRPTNLVSRYVFREPSAGPPAPLGEAMLPLGWVAGNISLCAAAAYGAVVALRRRQFAFAVPLIVTIALFTASTMSQGMERFRTPFLFALIFLAVAPWGLPRLAQPTRPAV